MTDSQIRQLLRSIDTGTYLTACTCFFVLLCSPLQYDRYMVVKSYIDSYSTFFGNGRLFKTFFFFLFFLSFFSFFSFLSFFFFFLHFAAQMVMV